MRIRRNFLPKSFQDAIITSFLLIIIPVMYYFEMFVVLPYFHELWGPAFTFHFCAGTFILWNICSNIIAIILCDTSIRGLYLPSTLDIDWKFCSACECVTPPRSWHCETCNICILRRDHHCKFSSCCIGHDNHRFFIVFILYMFIATMYASLYNFCFVWDIFHFNTFGSLLKIIFPIAALFVYFTFKELYIAAALLTTLGALFTLVLLVFHSKLILKNKTTHEKYPEYLKYDRGRMNNLKDILGEKWYLVWISPFIESKLPQDGINWIVKEPDKMK